MPHVNSHPHGSFAWYDLFTKDLEASKSFYAGLFGWEAREQPSEGEPYAMFLKDGLPVVGAGQMNQEMLDGGAPQTWNVYVTVNELEPVLARVEQHGGKVIFPPSAVGEVGRLAYFADPEGAILALWQPLKNIGAGVVDEPGTVCWVELASRDLDAARDFYVGVFGWADIDPPHEVPSGYRMLKNGEKEIGGIMQMTDEWGDMPAHWSVYFEVEDMPLRASRVADLGGELKFGPFDSPVGQIAVCADDGGAHFYMLQLTDEAKAKR